MAVSTPDLFWTSFTVAARCWPVSRYSGQMEKCCVSFFNLTTFNFRVIDDVGGPFRFRQYRIGDDVCFLCVWNHDQSQNGELQRLPVFCVCTKCGPSARLWLHPRGFGFPNGLPPGHTCLRMGLEGVLAHGVGESGAAVAAHGTTFRARRRTLLTCPWKWTDQAHRRGAVLAARRLQFKKRRKYKTAAVPASQDAHACSLPGAGCL